MCSSVRQAQSVERHATEGVRSDHDAYSSRSVSAGGSLNSLSVIGYGARSTSKDPTVGRSAT